jgi:hypothetical protein
MDLSSLAQMKPTDRGIKTYGIPLVFEKGFEGIDGYQQPLHKTTLCQTKSGLRLYGTREIITKQGWTQTDSNRHLHDLDDYWNKFLLDNIGVGLKGCRTVRLTTDIRGTTR